MAPNSRFDSFDLLAIHCPDIDHELYISPRTVDQEVYASVATLALCIYARHAPNIKTPPDSTAILDGEYRAAFLHYCVGRCAHPQRQEPEAKLEFWDSLGDHDGRVRRRFTVYLRTDIIDDGSGRLLGMQTEWAPVLKNVKVFARTAMWRQVQQWEEYDNPGAGPQFPDNWEEIWEPLRKHIAKGNWDKVGRLPRWDDTEKTEKYIYQEKDGDFCLKNKMQTWTCPGDLPTDPLTGRLLQIRPRGGKGYPVTQRIG